MKYISVVDFAEKHGVSERTARNYCAVGKIDAAQDNYKSILDYFRIEY